MVSDTGTDGISHEIHVAKEEDGELTDFKKFENVLDVMNLPNGGVKFYFEGEQKMVSPGRIVRSKVRGVNDAFRYRCGDCKVETTDIISQSDRGESITLSCSICEKETEHERRNIEEV